MRNNKYHTIGTVPKSKSKITRRGKMGTPKTQIHVQALSWLRTPKTQIHDPNTNT
jgi:hypothetical protein